MLQNPTVLQSLHYADWVDIAYTQISRQPVNILITEMIKRIGTWVFYILAIHNCWPYTEILIPLKLLRVVTDLGEANISPHLFNWSLLVITSLSPSLISTSDSTSQWNFSVSDISQKPLLFWAKSSNQWQSPSPGSQLWYRIPEHSASKEIRCQEPKPLLTHQQSSSAMGFNCSLLQCQISSYPGCVHPSITTTSWE